MTDIRVNREYDEKTGHQKLLVLGAGLYQLHLIEKGRALGAYVIAITPHGDYPGIEAADKVYEMLTEIDGEEALIIQNYKGFSPFLCPVIYDCGQKKEADYLVISKQSEVPVTKYKVTIRKRAI